MARDADKIERQMALLAMLMAERGRSLSADDVRDAIPGYSQLGNEETFKRRFSADRAELEQVGLVVAVTEQPDGSQTYHLPPERYYLPPITFTDTEVAALHACLQALDGRFPYAEPLRLALQQLALGRPAPTGPTAGALQVNLRTNDYTPQLADRIARCEESIARRKRIVFGYYSIGRDASARREVAPLGLVLTGGHWYLVGDDTAKGRRTFRLSRMSETPTYATKRERNDFERPADFDLSAYRDLVPWQLVPGGEDATVWIADELAFWVERTVGARGHLDPAPAVTGGRLLTTRCATPSRLVSWSLGLGDGAHVVAPPAVAEEARAALTRIAERHTGPVTATGGGGEDAADPAAPPATATTTGASSPRTSGRAAPRTQGVAPEKLTRLLALSASLIAALAPRQLSATVSARAVQAELRISRAELQESIDRLNCANFGASEYLVYTELHGDELMVQREQHSDVFSRPARLSPIEARACLRALDLVGRQVIGSSAALTRARAKIMDAAGLPEAPDTAIVAPFGGEGTGDVAETINAALRSGRALRIAYAKADANQTDRYVVDPFELFNAHDAWYLAGFARERGAERHFRLDRIAAAELTAEAARPHDRDHDPLAWVSGGDFGGETQTAVLRFDADVARWLDEEPFPTRRAADGSVLVWRRYSSPAWLAREVLKHAGTAEVLAPATAREAVAALAERTLAGYVPAGSPKTAPAQPAEKSIV